MYILEAQYSGQIGSIQVARDREVARGLRPDKVVNAGNEHAGEIDHYLRLTV